MTTQIQTAHRVKQAGGWRDGRPVEDPEKTKRWGFVTARPSEFLVHVRRGQVRTASSGQGATCFKWPRDAVAVIPTSLQRLSFSADQVTRERVGVEVVGLAVYRIAEPLLAYRVLNFSFPERAQEKLEETLCGMFVGATRRLVANLSVDDCLQKRKTALADELLREIAPVVGGRGRPDDQTTQGWGVVIDSIEVQEVRVLSNNVFEAMQAPYRAALDEQAQAARAQAAREVATREAACKRAVEAARIEAEMEIDERRGALAAARAEAEQQARLAAVEREAVVARQQQAAAAETERRRAALALAAAEAETQAEVARRALEVQAAKAEIESAAARREAEQQRAERARARWMLAHAERAAEAETARAEGQARAEVAGAEAEVQARLMAAEAQRLMAERLPDLAGAIGSRIGEMRVTQIGGEAKPLAPLIDAVAALIEMARSVSERRA